MSSTVSLHNQKVWELRSSTQEVEEYYPQLYTVEDKIIRRLEREFKDRAVLEIGVGAGRLSKYLMNISRDYVGIDYSAEMVLAARKVLSGADIRQMDARDLSTFDNASLDLIWFGFNGIDNVSHDDRIRILAEVRRLIGPSGAFVFSSHNIDSEVRSAFSLSHINRTKGLLSAAKSFVRYVQGIGNAIMVGGRSSRSSDYAILNDEAHGYRLLMYYISLEKQIEQLRAAGFTNVQAFGMEGEILASSETYSDGFMIHYVARP